MRRAQATAGDPLASQRKAEFVDRLLRAGHHAQARSVDRGQGEPGVQAREELLLRQGHGEHGAARSRLHDAAARGHQPDGVLQGEDPGQAGGDELADAVPEHGHGPDPPRHPEPRQRVLDREEGRLGEVAPP
jgi:hypothetical protein